MNHPFLLSNPYKRLLSAKRQSFLIANLYEQLGMHQNSNSLLKCSPDINCYLTGEPGAEYYSFFSYSQCRSRHCPICQLFRSFRMRALLTSKLPQNIKMIFVTLTQENCHFSDLPGELDNLYYAFRLFWKSSANPFLGCFRSTEITVEKKRFGYFHPHLHLLFHVDDNYFSCYKKRGYTAHWLSSIWKNSLNLDYYPVCHVSAVKSYHSLLQVTKYITKPSSYRMKGAPIILHYLHHGLYRHRLFSEFGTIKEMIGDSSSIDLGGTSKKLIRFEQPNFCIKWDESLNTWEIA